MKKIMQTLLILVGIIIGLVLLVTIAGLFFPEKHTGTVTRDFKQSPEEFGHLLLTVLTNYRGRQT